MNCKSANLPIELDEGSCGRGIRSKKVCFRTHLLMSEPRASTSSVRTISVDLAAIIALREVILPFESAACNRACVESDRLPSPVRTVILS